MKVLKLVSSSLFLIGAAQAFTVPSSSSLRTETSLNGLFDGFKGMGSGKSDLDEEWRRQQAYLANRQKLLQEGYFEGQMEARMNARKAAMEKFNAGVVAPSQAAKEDEVSQPVKKRASVDEEVFVDESADFMGALKNFFKKD
jgi:hypothetical protein